MEKRLTTLATIAPYLIWMALMMLLPASAVTYAVRSACTLAALCVYFFAVKAAPSGGARAFVTGLAAGVAVCLLWVLPEQWAWYRDWFVIGAAGAPSEPSVYDPSVCGWPLTLVRLAGSAFVIAVAEELFFRDFLYRWLQKRDWTAVDRRVFDPGAFFWMTGLFALEHDRWFAGALAGAVYGLVYIRRGLAVAILAHVVTNFLLGLYVIDRGAWGFW
jgi:CAAX prenyl protease-like protein